MNNQEIIERVYLFQQAMRSRNSAIATIIDGALVPLLEYRESLEKITAEKLKQVTNGVGYKSAYYLMKIFAGEDPRTLAEKIPKRESYPSRGQRQRRASGDNDGSWDNCVRCLEDS